MNKGICFVFILFILVLASFVSAECSLDTNGELIDDKQLVQYCRERISSLNSLKYATNMQVAEGEEFSSETIWFDDIEYKKWAFDRSLDFASAACCIVKDNLEDPKFSQHLLNHEKDHWKKTFDKFETHFNCPNVYDPIERENYCEFKEKYKYNMPHTSLEIVLDNIKNYVYWNYGTTLSECEKGLEKISCIELNQPTFKEDIDLILNQLRKIEGDILLKSIGEELSSDFAHCDQNHLSLVRNKIDECSPIIEDACEKFEASTFETPDVQVDTAFFRSNGRHNAIQKKYKSSQAKYLGLACSLNIALNSNTNIICKDESREEALTHLKDSLNYIQNGDLPALVKLNQERIVLPKIEMCELESANFIDDVFVDMEEEKKDLYPIEIEVAEVRQKLLKASLQNSEVGTQINSKLEQALSLNLRFAEEEKQVIKYIEDSHKLIENTINQYQTDVNSIATFALKLNQDYEIEKIQSRKDYHRILKNFIVDFRYEIKFVEEFSGDKTDMELFLQRLLSNEWKFAYNDLLQKSYKEISDIDLKTMKSLAMNIKYFDDKDVQEVKAMQKQIQDKKNEEIIIAQVQNEELLELPATNLKDTNELIQNYQKCGNDLRCRFNVCEDLIVYAEKSVKVPLCFENTYREMCKSPLQYGDISDINKICRMENVEIEIPKPPKVEPVNSWLTQIAGEIGIKWEIQQEQISIN